MINLSLSRIKQAAMVLAGKASANPFDRPSRADLEGNADIPTFNSDRQQLRAYNTLAWVAIAVDNLVRDCANQDYYFCDAKGKEIDPKRLPEDLLAPFERDFLGVSFREMLRMVVAHRALTGNAFLYKIKSGPYSVIKGLPDMFVPIIPDWLFVRENQGQLGIQEYIANFPSGQSISIKPEEMIHFRQNTLFNPWWGVGNVGKMRLLAEGEAASEMFRNEFMSRKASPSLGITDDSARSVEDHDRLLNFIRAKFEGKQNAGRILYLSGNNVKLQTLTMSAKDMQYIDVKQFDRQTTLSIFGVPPVVAGIPEDANRATAGTMRLQYLANTCNPIICEIEECINSDYVRMYYPGIFFKFRRHVTGDVEQVIKEVQSGLITPNRGAEKLGEATDPGDESRNLYYMPASYMPTTILSQPVQAPEPDKEEAEDVEDSGKKSSATPFNVNDICTRFTKGAIRPKQFQVKYIRAALVSRNAIEDKYSTKLSKYFEEQKARVLSAAEKHLAGTQIKAGSDDTGVNMLFDLNLENDELGKTAKSMHTSGVQKAIADITDITSVRVNLNLSNPAVLRAVNTLGQKIRGRVNETTLTQLRGVLVNAVNESWNLNEIQDAIQDKFDSWQGYRARMIARTEARAAWDAGAEVAYTQIGVETVDVVGCTEFEPDSDCGRQGVAVRMISGLTFHPNHIGVVAPAEEV